jgi:imidazolonepropionase-like amidohydrolase
MTETDTLVFNCTLIDCVLDRPIERAAIWAREGRIVRCGPEEEVRRAAPAEIGQIDLAGAYVMPGLVNMHTHFSLSLPGHGGDQVRSLGPHAMALYMAAGARETLRSGVTAVRCVGEHDHADFALRDAIAAGQVPGPRIFTAGRALVCTGGHGHEDASTVECDGADGFRRGVREQVKAGADLIKVMISGGIAGQYEAIDTRQLTRAEIAAVIETAHDWDMKVTAHAGPAAVIGEAVGLGLDCVEHGYQLTEPVAALMAERGAHYVPTLVVTRCGEFFDELGVPRWMQQRSLEAGPRHEQSYKLALAAGVPVMLGSDMPPFWLFQGTSATVRELEYMAAFGLTPLAALRAATAWPARWLGADEDFGTAQAGRFADLIAMDEDPTRDIAALRTLRWVMKGGQVVRDDREGAQA